MLTYKFKFHWTFRAFFKFDYNTLISMPPLAMSRVKVCSLSCYSICYQLFNNALSMNRESLFCLRPEWFYLYHVKPYIHITFTVSLTKRHTFQGVMVNPCSFSSSSQWTWVTCEDQSTQWYHRMSNPTSRCNDNFRTTGLLSFSAHSSSDTRHCPRLLYWTSFQDKICQRFNWYTI